MLWIVQQEGTRPYATMRFAISRQIWCQRYVCHDVCVEPALQPLIGEHLSFATVSREDSARLDVRACGFWGLRQQSAFSDVWVFNPCALSCRGTQMDVSYRRHERKERQTYEQHVCEVKWGSITPLVFSTSGGMGRAASDLQEFGLTPCHEAGSTLQHHQGLAKMPTIIFLSEICGDVPQGFQICMQSRAMQFHGCSSPRVAYPTCGLNYVLTVQLRIRL